MGSFFQMVAESLPLMVILCTILGLIIGSFFNVVIYRLPKMMIHRWHQDCQDFLQEYPNDPLTKQDKPFNLFFPASHCPHCQQKIHLWHNIPLISFILQKGKCASCHSKISCRYPLVEFLTAISATIASLHFGFSMQLPVALLFCFSLIPLIFIDIDKQFLPDEITLSILWIGLLVNLFGLFATIENAVIGALSGYLILWTVAFIFKHVTGKEGLGHGDFKLLAMFGAWLGWQQLPLILLIASFSGALISIILILLKRQKHDKPIPFGPYLAFAGWLSLLFGEQLLTFYQGLW